jgi:UDP-N-acetylmuramate dehydrogenase
MNVHYDVPLAELTTMRLGGNAAYVVEITTADDIIKAVQLARNRDLPFFVLGGGSNVIAGDDGFNGVIILNRIRGFEQLDDDAHAATYQIGAGEIWDSVVERLCAIDLSGVECMSGIPGYAGATPVQNVGAFGQEIADVLVELTAYDTRRDRFVTLSHDGCQFGYRDSLFKNPATQHHIIASLTLRLCKTHLVPPLYPALSDYLRDHKINGTAPKTLRAAVLDIRAGKLPDPRQIASAGSFFKNPIVSSDAAEKLLAKFPAAPHWDTSDGRVKLSAGWLIDTAGLKGFEWHGFQIYPKNALVITNLRSTASNELAKFKMKIVEKIRDEFDVKLEQEPEDLI